MLMAVCLSVNICVTTRVCISRCVADSCVSDDEHLRDESPDTCVCCFHVRCWQQCLIMNICVRNILTPVCLISRCLADSSVPDNEHLCDEHPDACVC